MTKESLERNSVERNWKTLINTDDLDKPEAFLSLSEAGGFNLSEQKDYVRSYIYEKRTCLSDDEIEEKSRRISENLTGLELFKNSRSIALYYPFRKEVTTRQIFYKSLESGKKVYFPRVNGTSLSFHRVDRLDQLEAGRFGIPEPRPGSFSIEPEKLDLVVVPGVAFDSGGRRLGYGKGYYDRYLPRIPSRKRIALAFGIQIVESVPAGEGDQGVGLVVTEFGIIFCRSIKGGN
ncbi:MAG: 5-formyltetrahydrofolate cyclo-ligase [Deltaproteobacteria bacterium]